MSEKRCQCGHLEKWHITTSMAFGNQTNSSYCRWCIKNNDDRNEGAWSYKVWPNDHWFVKEARSGRMLTVSGSEWTWEERIIGGKR